jgi:hypothetical protein
VDDRDGDATEQPGRDGQPPRVFVSYSDDSLAHAKRVLELAQWLRSHGVDAQIDQFEESPEEGWPRWIYRQIRESEFVLIIATPGYLRRCENDEPRGDTPSSTTKFGSHLTLQELHEAGGRNRKFVPVLFGEDAIVESVPLPMRGATCYRLPEQRDDLYRRLTGQPKVQRAPLGVLKTFDDETLLDTGEEPILTAEPPLRPRTSLDEQHAEDSLRALVDAGITDEYDIPYERRGRRRNERNQWRFGLVAFATAFLLVGLFMGQRMFVPDTQEICHIQLVGEDGNVIEGIDRVDLTLPSGHLIEVVIQDGRTLRFACPQDRVQAQAHVYLAEAEGEGPFTSEDVAVPRDQPLRVDGRVALPASEEAAGEAVTQTQLMTVTPARPIPPREPEPEPGPGPDQPEPVEPGNLEPVLPIKPQPVKRTPKVKLLSESQELQASLAPQIKDLRKCYELGLASDPKLLGKIQADVKIDPTGQVLDFKLVKNQLSSNDVALKCIREAIASWKAAAPKTSRGTTQRVEIDFAPPV